MPDGIGYQVSKRDMTLGADAKRQKEQFDRNPPSWAVNESLWEKAKKAADESGPHRDKWAVVAHIYQQMGGRVK